MQNETLPGSENVWIEISREGVLGIHGDITDTHFISLIGPAITHLDRTILDLRAFTASKV